MFELIVVMAILTTVVGALTALFVGATRSQIDLGDRVQAQNDAVMALDRLRRDVHCSSSATASSATSVTLAVPCVPGGVVSWCTASVATGRYKLHRRAASGTCASTNAVYADYLTTGSVFAYETASIDNLAKLRANLPVKPPQMKTAYTLCDILVMRNSVRVGAAGTAVPPC
jgi:type II secretory pathway pseudopilin PulG